MKDAEDEIDFKCDFEWQFPRSLTAEKTANSIKLSTKMKKSAPDSFHLASS